MGNRTTQRRMKSLTLLRSSSRTGTTKTWTTTPTTMRTTPSGIRRSTDVGTERMMWRWIAGGEHSADWRTMGISPGSSTWVGRHVVELTAGNSCLSAAMLFLYLTHWEHELFMQIRMWYHQLGPATGRELNDVNAVLDRMEQDGYIKEVSDNRISNPGVSGLRSARRQGEQAGRRRRDEGVEGRHVLQDVYGVGGCEALRA